MVYRLIGVEMDIKDVNDINLQTKELGCNYWSYYKWSLTICDGCFDTLKSSKM